MGEGGVATLLHHGTVTSAPAPAPDYSPTRPRTHLYVTLWFGFLVPPNRIRSPCASGAGFDGFLLKRMLSSRCEWGRGRGEVFGEVGETDDPPPCGVDRCRTPRRRHARRGPGPGPNERDTYLAVHESPVGGVVGDHDHQPRRVGVVVAVGLLIVRFKLALLAAHERQRADLRSRVTTVNGVGSQREGGG